MSIPTVQLDSDEPEGLTAHNFDADPGRSVGRARFLIYRTALLTSALKYRLDT